MQKRTLLYWGLAFAVALPSAYAMEIQVTINKEHKESKEFIKQLVAQSRLKRVSSQDSIQFPEKPKNDEQIIDTIFKDKKNRKDFSNRIFGAELAVVRTEKKQEQAKKLAAQKKAAIKAVQKQKEQKKRDANDPETALLEVCENLFAKKEYPQSSQGYWRLLQTSKNKSIQKEAQDALQKLHEEKEDRDAAYYLAVLHKHDPRKMINLFLQAENRRNILREKREAASLEQQADAINTINEESETESLVTATSEAMMIATDLLMNFNKTNYPEAYHALATYFCDQAQVFPAAQISALKAAAHYAEKALTSKEIPNGCYDYATITNYLGVALFDHAKVINSEQGITNSFLSNLNEAEKFLKIASNYNNNDALLNLAVLEEYCLLHLHQSTRFDIVLANYIAALEQGNDEAQKRIEILLIEGIDGIPLSITQRDTLFEALKKKNPDSKLFDKKNFTNLTPYATAGGKSNAPGSKQFYEALYWYDNKDFDRASEFLSEAHKCQNRAANAFGMNLFFHSDDSNAALAAIKSFWEQPYQLEYIPKTILYAAAQDALKHMVAANDISAIYTSIQGNFTGKINDDASSIDHICYLLEKGETYFTENPKSEFRMKITENEFIKNLLVISRKNKSPLALYEALSIAVARLGKTNLETETNELKKLICTIAKELNADQKKIKPLFSQSVGTRNNVVNQIDRFLTTNPEKHNFSTLIALRKVLKEGPQSEEKLFAHQPKAIIEVASSILSDPQLQASTKDVSEKDLRFTFLQETANISNALQAKNKPLLIQALRSIISQFRSCNAIDQYVEFTKNTNIFKPVERFIKNNPATKISDELFVLNLKLILIAHNSLSEKNYDLESNLQNFCAQYPIYGTAIVGREFGLNEFFAQDKAKALKYLQQAQTEAKARNAKQEVFNYINICEATINESSSQ